MKFFKKKQKLSPYQELYKEFLLAYIAQKKKLRPQKLIKLRYILPFLILGSGKAQTFNASIGMGVNYPAVTMQLETGHRAGPLYLAVRSEIKTNNYPAISIQPMAGIAASWNNNKMHELTSMAYAFYSHPVAGSNVFKQDRYQPLGIGIRHYVYNAYTDISWVNSTVTFTLGLSIGKYIYR